MYMTVFMQEVFSMHKINYIKWTAYPRTASWSPCHRLYMSASLISMLYEC